MLFYIIASIVIVGLTIMLIFMYTNNRLLNRGLDELAGDYSEKLLKIQTLRHQKANLEFELDNSNSCLEMLLNSESDLDSTLSRDKARALFVD